LLNSGPRDADAQGEETTMAPAREITRHQLQALRALPGPNAPGMVAIELAAGLGLGRRAAVSLLVSLEHDDLAGRCPDGGWRKTSAGGIAASPLAVA
jgi:hypothetical protein